MRGACAGGQLGSEPPMSRQHRSLMQEMMGRDPFADDPFFRDPFGMMGMDGGMVSARPARDRYRAAGQPGPGVGCAF